VPGNLDDGSEPVRPIAFTVARGWLMFISVIGGSVIAFSSCFWIVIALARPNQHVDESVVGVVALGWDACVVVGSIFQLWSSAKSKAERFSGIALTNTVFVSALVLFSLVGFLIALANIVAGVVLYLHKDATHSAD